MPRYRSGLALSLLLILATALGACGGDDTGDNNGDGDSGINDGDGGNNNGDGGGDGDGGTGTDAMGPAGCMAGGPQCNNCIDDDNDGQIDGFDIECTGAIDNDESSFATGIPGDNMDIVNQDCFFDGNSGSGNDGCNIHVCCLLGAPDAASCPFGPQQYDPAECDDPQSQQCQMVCGDLAPPGCDCFGCCTVCDPATNICYDIITNPATAPNCDATVISDPNLCPRCEKVVGCGNECDPTGCILCPGQTEEDLPPECNMQVCPDNQQVCSTEIACPNGQFCTNGCCIDGIP